jgi:hypothetical protein
VGREEVKKGEREEGKKLRRREGKKSRRGEAGRSFEKVCGEKKDVIERTASGVRAARSLKPVAGHRVPFPPIQRIALSAAWHSTECLMAFNQVSIKIHPDQLLVDFLHPASPPTHLLSFSSSCLLALSPLSHIAPDLLRHMLPLTGSGRWRMVEHRRIPQALQWLASKKTE